MDGDKLSRTEDMTDEEDCAGRGKEFYEEDDEDSDRQYKWRNDQEWNREDESSLAGEVSEESELSEEENLEDEEESNKNEEANINLGTVERPIEKKKSFDMDDVGTDDDLDSQRQVKDTEDYTENDNDVASDISEMSDIENQMSVAQNQLLEDKQSLRGVMGFVDEVTHKGEILAKKASETHLPAVSAKLSTEASLGNPFAWLEEDPSMDTFFGNSRGNAYRGPIRDHEEGYLVGQVEYLRRDENSEEHDVIGHNVGPSLTVDNLEPTSDDQKEDTALSKSDEESEVGTVNSVITLSEDERRSRKKASLGSNSDENRTIEKAAAAECDTWSDTEASLLKDSGQPKDGDSQDFEEETWEDADCSISKIHGHVCCFGGGGDGGRELEIISKLNKLKDDIVMMREELSDARKECKKESDEVAKLIEEAVARNKAAEVEDDKKNFPVLMTPARAPQIFGSYQTEDVTSSSQGRLLRAQAGNRALPVVPLPAAILETRLRSTRHSASATYRETLNELEKMVEKEMASIQDSMTRLEPLNKMAAEWDTLQKLRSMTYKRDYRMEMVMSEMRIQPENSNKNQQMEEVK